MKRSRKQRTLNKNRDKKPQRTFKKTSKRRSLKENRRNVQKRTRRKHIRVQKRTSKKRRHKLYGGAGDVGQDIATFQKSCYDCLNPLNLDGFIELIQEELNKQKNRVNSLASHASPDNTISLVRNSGNPGMSFTGWNPPDGFPEEKYSNQCFWISLIQGLKKHGITKIHDVDIRDNCDIVKIKNLAKKNVVVCQGNQDMVKPRVEGSHINGDRQALDIQTHCIAVMNILNMVAIGSKDQEVPPTRVVLKIWRRHAEDGSPNLSGTFKPVKYKYIDSGECFWTLGGDNQGSHSNRPLNELRFKQSGEEWVDHKDIKKAEGEEEIEVEIEINIFNTPGWGEHFELMNYFLEGTDNFNERFKSEMKEIIYMVFNPAHKYETLNLSSSDKEHFEKLYNGLINDIDVLRDGKLNLRELFLSIYQDLQKAVHVLGEDMTLERMLEGFSDKRRKKICESLTKDLRLRIKQYEAGTQSDNPDPDPGPGNQDGIDNNFRSYKDDKGNLAEYEWSKPGDFPVDSVIKGLKGETDRLLKNPHIKDKTPEDMKEYDLGYHDLVGTHKLITLITREGGADLSLNEDALEALTIKINGDKGEQENKIKINILLDLNKFLEDYARYLINAKLDTMYPPDAAPAAAPAPAPEPAPAAAPAPAPTPAPEPAPASDAAPAPAPVDDGMPETKRAKAVEHVQQIKNLIPRLPILELQPSPALSPGPKGQTGTLTPAQFEAQFEEQAKKLAEQAEKLAAAEAEKAKAVEEAVGLKEELNKEMKKKVDEPSIPFADNRNYFLNRSNAEAEAKNGVQLIENINEILLGAGGVTDKQPLYDVTPTNENVQGYSTPFKDQSTSLSGGGTVTESQISNAIIKGLGVHSQEEMGNKIEIEKCVVHQPKEDQSYYKFYIDNDGASFFHPRKKIARNTFDILVILDIERYNGIIWCLIYSLKLKQIYWIKRSDIDEIVEIGQLTNEINNELKKLQKENEYFDSLNKAIRNAPLMINPIVIIRCTYFSEFLTGNKKLFKKFSKKWEELKNDRTGEPGNRIEQYYVLKQQDYINGLYNIFYGLIKEAFDGRDENNIPNIKYSELAIVMENCVAKCAYYILKKDTSSGGQVDDKEFAKAINNMLKYAYLLNPIKTNINYPNLTTIQLVNTSVTSGTLNIKTIVDVSAAEEDNERM